MAKELNIDLYDLSRITGKMSGILNCSKFCTYDVSEKIKENIPEIECIKEQFGEHENDSDNYSSMKNALDKIDALCSWLLPYSNKDIQVRFIYQELHALLFIAEQKYSLLTNK